MDIQKKLDEDEKRLLELLNQETDNEKDPEETNQDTQEPKVVEEHQTESDSSNSFRANEQDVNKEVEHWKHKYNVLQGKYNAEIQNVRAQNELLQTTIKSLQSEIENLKQSLGNKEGSSQVSKPNNEALASFMEEYPDIYNVIQEMFKEKEQKYLSEIDRLKGLLEGTNKIVAETIREKFYRELTELAPNWSNLNTDTGFLAWLEDVDDFSGISRRQILNQAYEKLDSKQVAKIFKTYEQLNKTQPIKDKDIAPQQREKPRQFTDIGKQLSESEITSILEDIKRYVRVGNLKKANELEKRLEMNFNRR